MAHRAFLETFVRKLRDTICSYALVEHLLERHESADHPSISAVHYCIRFQPNPPFSYLPCESYSRARHFDFAGINHGRAFLVSPAFRTFCASVAGAHQLEDFGLHETFEERSSNRSGVLPSHPR